MIVSVRFAPYASEPRLLVRNGIEAVSVERCWLESFGNDAWIDRGKGATVQVGRHDSADVGTVDVIAAAGAWWHADLRIPDEHVDEVRPYLELGRPVSVGCRVIDEDRDHRIGTRHIKRAQLEHILLAGRGAVPGYAGAKIVNIRELASKLKPETGGWLAGLPDHWRGYVAALKPGAVTELIEDRRVAYRWNGSTWAAA